MTHPGRPDWLVAAADTMKGTRFFPEEKQISTTTLLKPAHMLRLQHRYQEVVSANHDPMDFVPAMVGVAFHQYVEKFGELGQTERPFHAGIAGWTITGIPDWFSAETGVLRDYKTTRMWSYVFGRREWEEQANIYRWLLRMNDVFVDKLEVHAVYLDWSENQVKRNADLPRERVVVHSLRVWPLEDVETFIKGRLKLIERWDTEKSAPICTPEERWERGEHWAVMKKGRKRAVMRCTTLGSAKELADDTPDLFVEHRPGDPVRCRSYCPVKDVCSFGRNIPKEG